MRDEFILTMVNSALAEVANRTEGRDRNGARILSQADIDRVPDGPRQYANQRMGQVVEGQHRSWFERLKGRFQ